MGRLGLRGSTGRRAAFGMGGGTANLPVRGRGGKRFHPVGAGRRGMNPPAGTTGRRLKPARDAPPFICHPERRAAQV